MRTMESNIGTRCDQDAVYDLSACPDRGIRVTARLSVDMELRQKEERGVGVRRVQEQESVETAERVQ